MAKKIDNYTKNLFIATLITVSILLTVLGMIKVIKINNGLDAKLEDEISVINVKEIRVKNNKNNLEYITSKLEDPHFNILFREAYEDLETKELVVEPMFNSEELNQIVEKLDTVDKFNKYIEDFIFDESNLYSNPIVGEANKMNCYGYTLLSMSFLETHFKDDYYYEIIQDYSMPHVYLKLYNKVNENYIRDIDLTIQDELSLGE